MMRRGDVVAAIAAGFLLSGCGSIQTVRTFKNHADEPPRLDVAVDRVSDLDATLALVDRLLTQTPVSPGDAWVDHLALTNDEAKRLGEELRKQPPYRGQPDQEIPILKRYRAHLEQVLGEAKASTGKYPSLLAAIGAPGKDAGDLATHWATLGQKLDAGDDAGARDAERAIQTDIDSVKKQDGSPPAGLLATVTTMLSVCYRLELETIALAPIVATQTTRALPSGTSTMGPDTASKLGNGLAIADVPAHLASIKTKVTRQTALLDQLAHALVSAENVSLDATAGFALKESALSTIVGITSDSFHAHLRAGGEAFFYNALKQTDQSSSDDGKQTKDLTGRLRTLRYDVKPILLASFHFDAGMDYGKIQDALGLRLGYQTDRVFASGGSISSPALSKQLGVSGAASDALDFGLGVFGVRSNVRVANFTTGTVSYADAAGNDLVDASGHKIQSPLTIHFTQIDLGYDLAFLLDGAKKFSVEELVLGFRYFQYKLPRILYELNDTAPAGSGEQHLVYANESRPQVVPSTYYMGGLVTRFGPGRDAGLLAPYFDIGFYIGGGPTSYHLRKNKAVSCANGATPGTGEECVDDLSGKNAAQTSSGAFAFDLSAGLGLRLRLVQTSGRFRLLGEAAYKAELVYANATASNSANGEKRQIDFGNADLFHGPRLSLIGQF